MTTSPRLTDSEQLDLERFKLARASEKLNTVSIALVVDELIRGMHKLGIKGDKIPNKEELSVMYKSIVEEYGHQWPDLEWINTDTVTESITYG